MAATRTDFGQWFASQAKSSPVPAADVERGGVMVAGAPSALAADGGGLLGSIASRLALSGSQQPAANEWTFGMSTIQRYQAAGILLCGSISLYALALFVFFPLILFAPAKFASSFTFASIMWLAAMSCVRGPRATLSSLLSNGNLPITCAYLGSMALTLYATLVVQSYLLIVAAVVVQMASAAYYSASFLPGGTSGMNRLMGWMLGPVAGRLNPMAYLPQR